MSGQFWGDLNQSGHEDEISYRVEIIEDASSPMKAASFLCIACGLEEKELPFYPDQVNKSGSSRMSMTIQYFKIYQSKIFSPPTSLEKHKHQTNITVIDVVSIPFNSKKVVWVN